MEEFTEEERKMLQPFFSNLDKPVFVLINLPEVVKGALFSRYSRSPKSLRRLLLEEFIKNPDMLFQEISKMEERHLDKFIATQKAEEFYEKLLIGFGDDSVAELAGVHLACEDVSQLLAAKALEDNRIGISPLEKSTRYVFFDEKVKGKYKYYRDPDIMSSGFDSLYEETMDFLFDTYSELIPILSDFIQKKFPKPDDVSDRAYQATVRAKVCDVLRQLLPASALTNVGLFGNGRAFEYLLNKMYASPLVEVRDLAASIQEELDKVIPSFVKRAKTEKGREMQEYIKTREEAMWVLAKKFIVDKPRQEWVELVDYDKDAEEKVISAILYPYCNLSLKELRARVKRMSFEEKKRIIDEYASRRKIRHHKVGRAFEHSFYTFDILAPLGAWKDLQRHRMLTQQRQLITTDYGYDVPKEVKEVGLESKYNKAMEEAKKAFNRIRQKMPFQAQYLVPLGFRVRWYFKLNLREVCHLTELRSTSQGHEYYRKIAQEMALKVRQVHPLLAEYATKFVDMKDYELERLEAEKKLDEKMKIVAEKYKK
jgi:thymidylate synthase ThyX